MTNTKTTKRALLASLMAMLLCFTMLLGTTYAWFTDSVTSAGNIIKTGTLDVTMEWKDGKEDPTTTADWKDAAEGAIFKCNTWEPGYVEVRHIKIENKGTLALKYAISIIANGTVSKLSDVIDVYYVDPAKKVEARADLTDGMKLGTLTNVLASLDAAGELKPGENHTITLALKMQETAGNEYQNLSIGSDFSIQLLATQYTSEADSIDNQYDKEAAYATTGVVTSLADLSTALAVASGSASLAADITGATTVAMKGGSLDGNGNTIEFNNGDSATTNYGIQATGGTITNIGVTGVTANGKGFRAVVVAGDMDNKDIVINNATLSGTYALNTAVISNPGKLIVTNSTLNGWTSFDVVTSASFTDCSFGASDGYANVRPYVNTTFDGCSFSEGFTVTRNGNETMELRFNNCTVGVDTLTAANFVAKLVETAPNDGNNLKGSTNITVYVDDVLVDLS